MLKLSCVLNFMLYFHCVRIRIQYKEKYHAGHATYITANPPNSKDTNKQLLFSG